MKKLRMTFLIVSFVGALCFVCVSRADDGSLRSNTNEELNVSSWLDQELSFSKDDWVSKRRGRQNRYDQTPVAQPQGDDDSSDAKKNRKKKRNKRRNKHHKKYQNDDESRDDESDDDRDEDGDMSPSGN